MAAFKVPVSLFLLLIVKRTVQFSLFKNQRFEEVFFINVVSLLMRGHSISFILHCYWFLNDFPPEKKKKKR